MIELSEAISGIGKCVNSGESTPTFNGRSIRFKLTNLTANDIDIFTNKLGLENTHHLNNESEIVINTNECADKIVLFYNEEDFCNRADNYLSDFENTYFVIFNVNGEVVMKLPGEVFTKEKSLFFNYYYFIEIFNFLLEQENFMSFHSSDEKRFVLFTSDVGPFDIKYDLNDLQVKNLEDLKPVYERLIKEFQKIDFVQFFKSAIINTVHSYKIEERFYKLIQSLPIILNVAIRDHYIYIRNFDFDKIKTKFKEERNTYFENLEKNIDSIKGQVTSFPLTFAATIFAAFQVKDRPTILILVFMAYALYTLIAWKILNITAFNKSKIKEDVDFEEDKIKKGYDLLYEEFKTDFQSINKKIDNIGNLIGILRTVLIGLLLCFFIFAVYQIFFVTKTIPPPIEVHITNKP